MKVCCRAVSTVLASVGLKFQTEDAPCDGRSRTDSHAISARRHGVDFSLSGISADSVARIQRGRISRSYKDISRFLFHLRDAVGRTCDVRPRRLRTSSDRVSLLVGLLVRFSAGFGALLMIAYWMAHMTGRISKTKTNFIIDQHLVYAGVLLYLASYGRSVLGSRRMDPRQALTEQARLGCFRLGSPGDSIIVVFNLTQ